MVPVGLVEALVAAHPPDGVLDRDPPPGEGAVVGDILRQAVAPARLAPGDRAQRVQPVQAGVAQVAERAHTGR